MNGETSLTPFEHYLWNELESSCYIGLSELTEDDIGGVYWSTSGNLEEAVVYVGNGVFMGINLHSYYFHYFDEQKPRSELQENITLGLENHRDASDLGSVRPYVKIGELDIMDEDNLQTQLITLNCELYQEKLAWLTMLGKTTHTSEDKEYLAFLHETQNRLERLSKYI